MSINAVYLSLGPLVDFTGCGAPPSPLEVVPDGLPPAPAQPTTELPAAAEGVARRQSHRTTTFGNISIPSRFIGNVGHGFRGRVYVSLSHNVNRPIIEPVTHLPGINGKKLTVLKGV